ncbi:2-hydroxyacyl-CoA dehydratase [Niveispirillum sp. KHB5.9]|uniref:2-hydroxyacyl-CoA dehydratase n=1 Tax=Niveispirillum sp. KHB5.9 TaxID=3400269 RepID=UPI003A89AEDE
MARHAALALLLSSADDPAGILEALRLQGQRPIRMLGVDAPRALVRAAGLLPVRLVPTHAPTPMMDAIMGGAGLSLRGKSLLEQLVGDGAQPDPVLITSADNEQPQVFAALRELARDAGGRLGPVHFLDRLYGPGDGVARYNDKRLAQLHDWLAGIGAPVGDVAAAEADEVRLRVLLGRVLDLRPAGRLTGAEATRLVVGASLLPLDQAEAALSALLTDPPPVIGAKHRLFLTGSTQEDFRLYDALEAAGALVAGETQDWGRGWCGNPAPMVRRAPDDAASVIAMAQATGAEALLHVTRPGDEASPWDVKVLRDAGLPFLAVTWDGTSPMPPALAAFLADPAAPATPPAPSPPPSPARAGGGRAALKPPTRSRKSLAAVASFGQFQRDWFAGLREQVAAGSPLAVVNANAPQEILRALDIPFVVNQWWASIVAAKQQSGRYFGLLRERGYPADVEAYSAQGLAATFDADAQNAPWGGLPRPDFLAAVIGTDATARIFRHWADETGADLFLYQRSFDSRWTIPVDWWDDLPDDWDRHLEPERLDLLEGELRAQVAALEAATGRRFDPGRFAQVMDLVNEQEDWYRRTRDLIAASHPAPVGIVDTMPATMVPQWHRGSVWARDAAKALYDEVAARVAAGEAACPNERVRLMWVGRGLWSDMGFYQRWEESHGAVFVCSMYLSLAADGYIRRHDRGRDPMRALAARFVTMGDELRMPTWAGAWHVRDARIHGVHGAVALADADPFVLRALEEASIPILRLDLDNYNQEGADEAAVNDAITGFIEMLG